MLLEVSRLLVQQIVALFLPRSDDPGDAVLCGAVLVAGEVVCVDPGLWLGRLVAARLSLVDNRVPGLADLGENGFVGPKLTSCRGILKTNRLGA